MIEPKQAIKLYEKFAGDILPNEKWYKSISQYIKATLLYGSVAKGTNSEESDIDILIIVPLGIEEKFTDGEYFYTYREKEINIVLRSIEKLRLIAKEHKDAFLKEVFRKAVIINADDEVKTLLETINSIEN